MMLDVSKKIKTLRTATAEAHLTLAVETVARIREQSVPKGDPLEVARVAGIQAAKETSRIIPFCHPLPLDHVAVEFTLRDNEIIVTASAKAIYKTGVEMEAMTAAAVAALTLYDMLKMLDESMEITGIKLLTKRGGKSDFRQAFPSPLRAAVLVMSDSIASGKKDDLSGRLITERLQTEGIIVEDYKIVPDDIPAITELIHRWCDDQHVDLVMTTGGTGFSPRDNTPEAMQQIFEREIPGIPEAVRQYGVDRTPHAMLSRARAGIRGRTIIINLPGSKRGVAESLDALFPGVLHAFPMLRGGSHEEDPRARKSRS
jgi:cyclic pyranopterin monophosphate synthase